jgi:MFS superfamily sulfate permease-like transporter
VLVAVVGATLVTGAFDLAAQAGLSVVGVLPQGLPLPARPFVTASSIAALM